MPNRYPNTGKPPRDKTVKLWIEWRNGQVSKWTYTADQLVWQLRGQDHDIAFFGRAEG